MAARANRRPLISLQAHLQSLLLSTSLESNLDYAAQDNLQQLGPIIKSLDEAGQADAFLRVLRDFARGEEQRIQRICDDNSTDFVSAVDKLLKVRSSTISLKHRVGELNEEVQAGGSSLGSKKKSLVESQRTMGKVDDAIETLQLCLKVLDMAKRIDVLIDERNYYPALRSLDELEAHHLSPLLAHDFAHYLHSSLPSMRWRIRQAVIKEMKEWLFEVRQKSRTVGKLALKAMEDRQRKWRSRSERKGSDVLRVAKVNGPVESVYNERTEYSFMNNSEVHIDFSPLYQCIHIHDVLDLREELQRNYQEDRRAQANLLLSQGLSFHPSNPTFPALLEEVVGFFLVEHHVLDTCPPGFRSEQEVDDLWDDMCERVVDIVSIGLRDSKDTRVFVATKAVVQTFIQTLEGYSFSVGKLNALLLTLFERYAQLLRDRFTNDFKQAIRQSEHQPMVVNTKEELDKVLNVCWLRPRDAQSLKEQQLPLALPFSQTYPLCCMDIRSLVDQYYVFSDGFSQHHRDIDDILKKSLDDLLIQQVSNAIRHSVETTSNLSQITQIVVNAEHFKLACTNLERLLAALRAPHRGGTLRLDASSHFTATLDIAQARIDSAIGAKLLEFIELEEMDWTRASDPPTGRAQPSSYIFEMLTWLETMMESVLVLLPRETKLRAYRSAFRYVANQLLDGQLLAREVEKVSPPGLRQLQRDVEAL
ncbi:exocyst complex subunit Sec15-like protein, partial [Jaminaea rosea]